MSQIVIREKPVDLEKLDRLQKSNSWIFDSDELGRRAKMMFDYVESLKTERSKKAILIGIYLQQVKAALGHGEFDKWKSKHFAKGRSTIGNYMSLAAKFSRSAKLLLPEIVAANQLSLDLKSSDSTGEAFMSKLDKFVGSSGLTELMQKHDVITARNVNPETGKRIFYPSKLTKEQRDAARLAAAHAQAHALFCNFSELGERWMALDDGELRVAVEYVEKFLKRARKWLATPPPSRARYDAPETLEEKTGLVKPSGDDAHPAP